MSHYARNHLQDDWAGTAAAGTQARVQAAERDAGWYFDQATAPQKAEFDAAMHSLLGVTGPRANRARDAARARWRAETAEACALLEATVECLLETGEVSGELDERWTALFERNETLKMAAE
jgi:hypothetical protein